MLRKLITVGVLQDRRARHWEHVDEYNNISFRWGEKGTKIVPDEIAKKPEQPDTPQPVVYTDADTVWKVQDALNKAGYEDITLPLAAIQYIEARNNYACIHLDNREDVVPQMTLKSLLELLPEGKFVRIHRSYVIPVHRIESKKATSVKLVGVETPLPVGRAHKENLK